jgi:putative transposase
MKRMVHKNHQSTCKKKLLFHSDRGVQYACNEFTDLLKNYNGIQSMSR